MLERADILSAVRCLLDRVRQGEGGALFVVGEPGLGKTSVLDRACALHRAHGSVGRARGDAMEAALPFSLLTPAIEGLGGRDVLEPAAAAGSAASIRSAVFLRVLRWLEALGAGPVLLALDDLHWADADSLALLSFLCRRIAALPVAVIGTLRPWPVAAEQAAMSLAQAGQATIERLSPLSEGASTALLSARLGSALPAQLTERALLLCAGNPLLLEQIAAIVGRGDEVPLAMRESMEPASARLLLARFAGLPGPAVRCAQAATVLGSRFSAELAAEVGQLAEDEVEAALTALSRSGLVQDLEDGALEFVHPLFRQALYEDIGGPLRARLHARAFAGLVRRGMEPEAAEHAVRADLVGNSDAIGVLERVGRAALQAGALFTAARWLEAALRLARGRAGPGLLLALGEALLATGRAADLVPTFQQLASRSDLPAGTRVEALRILGRALHATGDYAGGALWLDTATDLAEHEDARAAVGAVLDRALSAWMVEGPVTSLRLLDRARVLAARVDDATRARVEGVWGMAALEAGDPTGLHAAWALAADIGEGPPSRLAELCWASGGTMLLSCGKAASMVERFAESERIISSALAAAERTGAASAIASLAFCHAETLTRRGRLEEALALVTRSSVPRELVPAIESIAAVCQAGILLHLGRVEDCDVLCDRVEAGAARRGEWLPLLWVWHLRGQRRLHEGQPALACAFYEKVEATVGRVGVGEPCLVPWARHAVGAYVACGRGDDAARVIGWVERHARRLPCRWPRIAAATGHALLADQRGDRAGAETHFAAAVALHREVDLPLEEVETLLAYGAFLRRSGQAVRARPVLARGLALAERSGAVWLAGYARSELAVAGGRRRRRRERTPDELTPQERRVAHLAAAGQSNQEIAGQMWLSTRTVESHLEQVYAKLGIRSRRQLMAMELERVKRSAEPPTSRP